MLKTIEIKEARTSYALPLDEAQLAEGPLIVQRQGKPIAAIIPFSEYERYRTWREKEQQAAVLRAQLQKFERERAAFLRLKPQLLQTHHGQFVAIHEGKVVDTDQDNQELVKRVIERYGNEPVYIQLVAEELRTFEIPSPEAEYQRFVEWQKQVQTTTWQEGQKRLLQKEIAALERMKPELLNTHKGKQVAILNGQVVDSDEDKRALARRVYAKYGYRTILMTEVREQRRVYRIDSPEVKQR